MAIFIEDIFIENFIFFLLLTIFVSKVLGQKENFLKHFFSASFVSCFETASIVLNLGKYGQLLILILNIFLLILLSQKGTKKLFVSFVISLSFIFIIDGIRGALLKFEVILPLLEIFVVIFVLFLFKLIKHFYNIKKHKKFEYKIDFFNGQNVFSTIGYLDSGNFLLDGQTQKPVVIIDYNTFLHITGIALETFLQGKYELRNSHYIDYVTISGRKKMLVFEVDEIMVDGHKIDCILGLNLAGFENGYSALLGVQALGDRI